MLACLLGVAQLIFAVLVEAEPESRADREQTLLRVQCRVDLNKKSILEIWFNWRLNLDRLLRMKRNVPDLSLQITTLHSIVGKLAVKDVPFACRHQHGLVR